MVRLRRDSVEVAQAKTALETIYGWLDRQVERREWPAGEAFSLADCAAVPALFYADWFHPIPEPYASLRAYRIRVLARPSVARAFDEARLFRHYFPLGAPDRD